MLFREISVYFEDHTKSIHAFCGLNRVLHVDGERLCLWTAATHGPVVYLSGEVSEYGTSVEWYWQWKTEGLREKPVPLPLCQPQIPRGLTRTRTQAPVVICRRPTNRLGHGTAKHRVTYWLSKQVVHIVTFGGWKFKTLMLSGFVSARKHLYVHPRMKSYSLHRWVMIRDCHDTRFTLRQ
jgi:hypothetical protein